SPAPDATPPETAAAGAGASGAGAHDTGEPATVQFAAVPPEDPEPAPAEPALTEAAAEPEPAPAEPAPADTAEPATVQFAAIPLVFQISGSAEVKIERGKLLSQIDDYLLPRVRRSAAPILVALVGSTGAGKSTLVNSIVGAHVSATGVRRPTTNSPVLAC